MTAPVRRLRRLLVLLPSTAIGGAERHTATLVHALVEAGVDVTIAAEPALVPSLTPLFSPLAVVAAPVGWREAERMEANAARQAGAAAALIARYGPEAVLLPLPWPSHGIGLQRALTEARLPGLAIAHLAPHEPVSIPAGLLRPALAAPLAWAAVSAPVAGRVEALFGLAPGQVAVVPNGVAMPMEDPARRAAQRLARRAALGLDREAPLVLFAGRLEEKKGADLLPALAERLWDELGVTLVALGEGPLADSLAAHPAARLSGPLRLPGLVDDVGDWLLAADALVLPSRLEGCPLIALEAAARRCPIIATVSSMEYLGDAADSFAWIVEPPSVLGLTDHVSVILRKATNLTIRLDAAEAHVASRGMQGMLSQYFMLLRSLMAGYGRYG